MGLLADIMIGTVKAITKVTLDLTVYVVEEGIKFVVRKEAKKAVQWSEDRINQNLSLSEVQRERLRIATSMMQTTIDNAGEGPAEGSAEMRKHYVAMLKLEGRSIRNYTRGRLVTSGQRIPKQQGAPALRIRVFNRKQVEHARRAAMAYSGEA